MGISNEINFEGKVAIKLAENNYAIKGKVLVTVFDSTLYVYEIKQPLNRKEIKMLNTNLERGLEAIASKLRGSAPVTVTNGQMYYDDFAVVYGADEMVYLAVF